MISQEAIHFLTECIWADSPDIYTPSKLCPTLAPSCFNMKQVAMPMVHPTTGETISSYKRLMHDPATAKTWQTTEGLWKHGTRGQQNRSKGDQFNICYESRRDTQHPQGQNSHLCPCRCQFPPTKDRSPSNTNYLQRKPHQLPWQAFHTPTADLTTSKLMWNSVLSTPGAKYVLRY